MKKRNKKHRPKPINSLAYLFAIQGTQLVSKDKMRDLKIKHSLAMEMLTMGQGTKTDFDTVLGCVNMSLCMCELHFTADYLDDLKQGKTALKAIGERFYERGRFVLSGDEIKVLRLCIEICEGYVSKLTVREVEHAIDEVFRRLHYKINTETIKKPEVTT